MTLLAVCCSFNPGLCRNNASPRNCNGTTGMCTSNLRVQLHRLTHNNRATRSSASSAGHSARLQPLLDSCSCDYPRRQAWHGSSCCMASPFRLPVHGRTHKQTRRIIFSQSNHFLKQRCVFVSLTNSEFCPAFILFSPLSWKQIPLLPRNRFYFMGSALSKVKRFFTSDQDSEASTRANTKSNAQPIPLTPIRRSNSVDSPRAARPPGENSTFAAGAAGVKKQKTKTRQV